MFVEEDIVTISFPLAQRLSVLLLIRQSSFHVMFHSIVDRGFSRCHTDFPWHALGGGVLLGNSGTGLRARILQPIPSRTKSGYLKEVTSSVGRDVRKPVFGVFDIARLEPAYSATGTS